MAQSLTKQFNQGDEIVLTEIEHHANIIPWQMAAKERGLKLKFVNIDKNFNLDLEHFESLLSEKTKIV